MIAKIAIPLLLCTLPLHSNEEGADISTHSQYSASLVVLLKKTLVSLQACRDVESTKAQLSTLKLYQKEMDVLARVLVKLPSPSAVDYVQAHDQLIEFNRTWRLISEEIQRLEREGLLSKELMEVLKVRA